MKKTLAAFLLLCTMGMTAPSLPNLSSWFADVIAKVCTRVAQPSDSPGAGTYSSTQSVTIADSYGGSTLYVCYTTDGTTPYASYSGSSWSCGNGAHYTGAFNISATATLKAIGCATNYSCSTLDSSLYTISASNTFTLVQKVPVTTGNCVSNPCTVTVSSTGSNHLLILDAVNTTGAADFLSSISGGGTWVVPAGCQVNTGASGAVSCGYSLSSSSGVTSISVTFNTTATYVLEFWEYSFTGSNTFLDNLGTANNSSGATTQPGVVLTLSGTSDIINQFTAVGSGTPTGISSPYGNFVNSSTDSAFADNENTSSGAAPTWTQSTATQTVVAAIAFK